jgi:hypothetical protein
MVMGLEDNVTYLSRCATSPETLQYRGQISKDAAEVLERTQRIYDAIFMMNSPGDSPQDQQRRENASKEFSILSKNCPHERLFLISESSQDTSWELARPRFLYQAL